jgi:hypothetical protein
MLEAFFLPPAGSHRTYDSIYPGMQILSSTDSVKHSRFVEYSILLGGILCASVHTMDEPIFIIVP